ncbi:integrase arm-type DNA-binding domain-containing protein [Methylocystis sp. IM3]|uniref:tyrosine-type recombinase/integrase n=1 Tax=Methylocystis sp. IM3 TaxID=3136722 RepID=UPI00311A4E5E
MTVTAIEKLKPGLERREVPDGFLRGLYFVLQPSGTGSWAYRYRVAGKPKKLTLGAYPAIGLKAARELASDAATVIAKGGDPAAEKQSKKAAARAEERKESDAIERVVETFLERYARRNTREATWRETERLLRREIAEPWKGRGLCEITRADLHARLDEIADRAPIVANRTLAAFRRLCGWAVERGIIGESPCEKVRAPAAEQSRDRVLSEDEIRVAWQAFEASGWPFGPLAKLLLLTGARRDEVGEMAWSEVDLAARSWTVPKERCKNGVTHEIPLSYAAVRILESLPRIAGSGLVFTTNGRTPVSGFSRFKAQVDRAMAAGTGQGTAIEPWKIHDLRRTAASGMAAIGIAPHIVESALNHKSGTIKGVAAVYNRYSYSSEKRAALDAWARRLDEIVIGAPARNVVNLASARV